MSQDKKQRGIVLNYNGVPPSSEHDIQSAGLDVVTEGSDNSL